MIFRITLAIFMARRREAAAAADNQENAAQPIVEQRPATPQEPWRCKAPFPDSQTRYLCDHVNEAGTETCNRPEYYDDPSPRGGGIKEDAAGQKLSGFSKARQGTLDNCQTGRKSTVGLYPMILIIL
ncbi:15668b96-0e7e-45b9-9087-f0c456c3f5cd [Sclerotinia trifoliorum]|uniref:15668b96-0e7e-45b9-9087-f0c456c3f5cd n=1 Tax=Sclerotinia trifoliorum TaxID=28548 RepID=A0A8H2W4G8_9HELO|nr:15668b96-0e7e-45b9-9087-f0c456c3f5cd [Sclerotinia trifoliorum]